MDSLPRTLNAAMKETEKILIENSLRRWQGDKNKAAAELDVPLRTFYYKCKTLGIKYRIANSCLYAAKNCKYVKDCSNILQKNKRT